MQDLICTFGLTVGPLDGDGGELFKTDLAELTTEAPQ